MKKSDNTHSEHEFLCLIHEFIFGTTTAHLILDPPFIIKSLEKISQTTLCKQKKDFFFVGSTWYDFFQKKIFSYFSFSFFHF